MHSITYHTYPSGVIFAPLIPTDWAPCPDPRVAVRATIQVEPQAVVLGVITPEGQRVHGLAPGGLG